ncbi:MAG: hypothetical protein RR603_05490 [Kurthia sp.]
MNDLGNASITNDKVVQLLEEQLAYMKQQNGDFSKQNEKLLKRIEALTEQVYQLTMVLYGPSSEKSKYQAPDGQFNLLENDPSFNDSE